MRFISQMRVFFVGLQDTSNQWIIDQFPKLWLIFASNPDDKWQSSYRGMFWGGDMSVTSREWINENIHHHTALADNYPVKAFTGGTDRNPYGAMKEGDSPSLLFFLKNGLNVSEHPEWGGWGGRYREVRANFFGDASDHFFDVSAGKEINSPRASVFRWRPDFQSDFTARADWGKASSFVKANHPPKIILNGETNQDPLVIKSKAGDAVLMDASSSSDPDGNHFKWEWIYYPEAGDYPGDLYIEPLQNGKAKVQIPQDASGKMLHIILRLSDEGEPSLSTYQRVIIGVE